MSGGVRSTLRCWWAFRRSGVFPHPTTPASAAVASTSEVRRPMTILPVGPEATHVILAAVPDGARRSRREVLSAGAAALRRVLTASPREGGWLWSARLPLPRCQRCPAAGRGAPAHFERVSQHLAPARAVERRSSPVRRG